MNKIVKGSIAAAAGVALLLGGAGTFALWNDSSTVNVTSIQAGTLALSQPAAGKWYVAGDSTKTAIDTTTYRVIPGSSLVYEASVQISASGNGLSAKLSYTGGVTGGGAELVAAVGNPALTVTYPTAVLPSGTANAVNVTPLNGTSNAAVKVVFTFPAGTAGSTDKATQGETVTFTPVVFTLAQQ